MGEVFEYFKMSGFSETLHIIIHNKFFGISIYLIFNNPFGAFLLDNNHVQDEV